MISEDTKFDKSDFRQTSSLAYTRENRKANQALVVAVQIAKQMKGDHLPQIAPRLAACAGNRGSCRITGTTSRIARRKIGAVVTSNFAVRSPRTVTAASKIGCKVLGTQQACKKWVGRNEVNVK